MTEFSDIIAELRRHRSEAMRQVEALDNAITELTRASGGPAQDAGAGEPETRRRARRGQGVKQQVIDFVRASPRDWDAQEIQQEFALQGKTFDVGDPLNAIRSALSRGSQAGHLVRTSPGRYAGAPSTNGEVSYHPEELEEPASPPPG